MAYKRQIGIRDFHIAPLTAGSDTASTEPQYTTSLKINGAISASSTVNASSESFYSDDVIEEVLSSVSSVTFEVEVSNLSIKERAALLGQNTSGAMANGNKDDISPEVAVMFRSKKTDGTFRYVCLPKCKFSVPSESYATEADSVTAQTMTLTCEAMPLMYNGNYKITLDENDAAITTAQKAAMATWFTTPVIDVIVEEE